MEKYIGYFFYMLFAIIIGTISVFVITNYILPTVDIEFPKLAISQSFAVAGIIVSCSTTSGLSDFESKKKNS